MAKATDLSEYLKTLPPDVRRSIAQVNAQWMKETREQKSAPNLLDNLPRPRTAKQRELHARITAKQAQRRRAEELKSMPDPTQEAQAAQAVRAARLDRFMAQATAQEAYEHARQEAVELAEMERVRQVEKERAQRQEAAEWARRASINAVPHGASMDDSLRGFPTWMAPMEEGLGWR